MKVKGYKRSSFMTRADLQELSKGWQELRWRCEGRTQEGWRGLRDAGYKEQEILIEGGKATGGQTAQALVLMAGFLVTSDGPRAGAHDAWDDEGIDKLLRWLRRWRRGLLPRAHDSGHGRRAGGGELKKEGRVAVGRKLVGGGLRHRRPRV